jgi:hypothetical protein
MKSPMAGLAGTLGWCGTLAALLALARLETPVRADEPAGSPSTERRSRFTFNLLPKSLQRRPSVDFHVITELTEAGRKLAPPNAAAPVYYIAQPGQFTQMGTNTTAGETPPNLERLTQAMEKALASSGYLKAAPTTPIPALAVVFNYGSFARFSTQVYDMRDDQLLEDAGLADSPMLRSDQRSTDALLTIVLDDKAAREDILQRATLIGGEKFTRNLAGILKEESVARSGGPVTRDLGFNPVDAAGPFHRFINANPEIMRLVEDSFNDCYFVIASAFDYVAMKKGQRVLLWRTKMTVNANGISMTESLPALVAASGPYLGKDMPDAATLTRRISRDGRVELGELQVLESDVSLPGAAKGDPAKTNGTIKPNEPD